MGNVHIPFRALFERLNIDYVIPPANTQRTLSLATKHSPEGLCIPFKLTTGNLIEALEMGADKLLVPAGYGICRLGYYYKTQAQILRDMGYQFEMIPIGVSERKLLGILEIIRRLSNNASWAKIISAFHFGISKINALDKVERKVHQIRPVECIRGSTNRIYTRAIEAIDQAPDSASLKRVARDYMAELDQVPRNGIKPLIVGITGEFYVMLEPFSNLDTENELGKLGVEVRRSTFISEWTKFSFFLNPLGINEKRKAQRAAAPYLNRDIGGDGWESVGEKVLHAGKYDGIVHLAPFTCMPEIIAQNIMPRTKEQIPVLTVLCDEQLAKPGVLTRLEAFVDMLNSKRRAVAMETKGN
jgi:predicted nucleotide-binding protein (sugar kinase/HSP70/actin superfamily)